MTHVFWKESKCIGGWLHRYDTMAMHEQGVLEMCGICKKKVFHKVYQDTLNHTTYLRHHHRDVLTPQHNQFIKEYGQRT